MHATPHKISLIVQTQAVLLEGMRLRRWQHELPGERILSRELQISRWTLRAALAELGRTGAIKISQGMPCAINPRVLRVRQRQSPSRKVALLMPAPLSKLRGFVSLWVDEFRIILNEHGIQLTLHDLAKAYRPNSKHALETFVEKHPHNDWLLLLSTRAMQEWFQTRSEFTVIAGTRFEGIHLPSIDVASYAAGVHAAHSLLGLGHRRLAFLGPAVSTAGVLAAESGLRKGIGNASYASASLVVAMCNEEPGDICRAVDRLMAEPLRPTVLVGARAAPMLTAFSHLVRLKLRVPHDISLLSIEWEPFLKMVLPQIAHYEISAAKYARQIAKAFFRPPVENPEPTYMTPQFVSTASLRRLSS